MPSAPFPHRLQRPRQAPLGRVLAQHRILPSRPHPNMGEAQEVEGDARSRIRGQLGPKVNGSCLLCVQLQPKPGQALAEDGQHPLAVPLMLEEQHEIVRIPHPLAPTPEAGLRSSKLASRFFS